MPSDLIIASIIVTLGIGGSIIAATRNLSIDYGGTAHINRNDDRVMKTLNQINKSMKKLDKKVS